MFAATTRRTWIVLVPCCIAMAASCGIKMLVPTTVWTHIPLCFDVGISARPGTKLRGALCCPSTVKRLFAMLTSEGAACITEQSTRRLW